MQGLGISSNITIVGTGIVRRLFCLQDTYYSIVNKDVTMKTHPEPLRPFLPEIAEFARHSHEKVMHPILR